MNMTIEEAIKHCIDIANSVEGSCPLCAEEHLVLAEWLAELGRYKDIGTVEDFQRLVTEQSLDVQLAKARHYARLLKEGLSDEEMTDSEKIEFAIGFSDMILQTAKGGHRK